MPSHNIPPDASRIAPFLTHEVSFHGRTTLIPPDSSGRVRREKQVLPARSRPESVHSSRRFNGTLQHGPSGSAGRTTATVLPQREHSRDRTALEASTESLRLASYRDSVVPDDPPPAYESDCNPQFRVPQAPPSRSPLGGIQQPEQICASCSRSVHHHSSLSSASSPTSEFASTPSGSDTSSEADVQIIDAQKYPSPSTSNDPPLSPSSSSITERVRNGLRRQKSAIGILASPVASMSSSSRAHADGELTASSSVVNLGETQSLDEPLTRTRSLVVVSRDESEDYGSSQLQAGCSHQTHQRSASHPFSLLRGGSSSSSNLLSRTSPSFLKNTHCLLPTSSRHKPSPSPLNVTARTRSFSPARNKSSAPSIRTVGTTASGETPRRSFFPSIRSRADRCRDGEAEEAIDSWEVLPTDCESAPRPSSPVLDLRSDNPVQSASAEHEAAPVTQPASQPDLPETNSFSTLARPVSSNEPSDPSTSSMHPLSLRDRKVPPPPPLRKTKRPPPPPPLRIPPISGSPPIVTVRSKRSSIPPPIPSRSTKPTYSPAAATPGESTQGTGRARAWQETSSRAGGRTWSPHELALTIPLPQTPGRLEAAVLPRLEAQSVTVPDVPVPSSILFSESNVASTPASIPPSEPPTSHASVIQSPPSNHSSSIDTMRSPMSLNGRSNHYHGRPLPTPPQDLGNSAYAVLFSPRSQGSDRVAFPVASPSTPQHAPVHAEASPRSPARRDAFSQLERSVSPHSSIGTIRPPSMLTPTQYRSPPTVPEGLLIDLRNSVLVEDDLLVSPVSPAVTTPGLAGDDLLLSWDTEAEGVQVRPNNAAERPQASSSPMVPTMERPLTPALSTDIPPPRSGTPSGQDLTDLDILLSQVTDQSAASGSDYDALLMISRFLGPASPTRVERSREGTPLIPETTPSPPPHPNSAPPIVSTRTSSSSTTPKVKTHPVQEQRRRVMKDGRVKLKLMLEGINVDKCGICFSQFKKGDDASMGSLACQHAFHGKCLGNWYNRSRTCPHCRQPGL